MRFKTLDRVKPGEVVGMDVFDLNGHVVVAKGIALTEKLLNKLTVQGYVGIYVDDFVSYDIRIAPSISPALTTKAKKSLEDGNIEMAIECARELVEDVIKNGRISPDMNALKRFDDFSYTHSVNVAVISCVIGMYMHLSEEELDALVLAGLLRDIGKEKIPKHILNKPDKLTKDEYELVKTHSSLSYEIIADRKDIPSLVKNAVLMHHENEDGSGYPLGVTGEHTSVITKILHVVDIYDALISDKPYKEGNTPTEAAEYLMGACGVFFDKEIVNIFLQNIPLYQKGTEIVLSTGEHAIVIENSGDNNLRPKIRMIDSREVIDLSERKNISLTFKTLEAFEKGLKDGRVGSSLSKETPNIGYTKRILVVDDMRMNRILLKGILSEKYDLEFAESGEAAIDIISHDLSFDLIIMDIDMPGISGLTAAEKINEIDRFKIPILFVTTVNNKETVIKCRELRAAGYIARPYQTVYVQTEVERIIYNNW